MLFVVVSVAQLVEPRIVIPVVVGSSPIVHPIFFVKISFKCWCYSSDVVMQYMSGYSAVW